MNIERLETTARDRNIAAFHKLGDHIKLFVHWQHVKKCFEYYTVDVRLTKPGVHTLDGFTNLTREQAIDLLK